MSNSSVLKIVLASGALAGLTGCLFFAQERPLSQAASTGDLQTMRELLKRGADPDEKGAHGFTALIAAAREGQPEAIHLLIRAGADPNGQGGLNDWTPLMHAIHKGQKSSVSTLLRYGADVDLPMRDGSTALIMASGYGYAEIVQVLLNHGADARVTGKKGETPLLAALGGSFDHDRFTVGSCQTETVKELVKAAPEARLPQTNAARLARATARMAGCKEALRLAEYGTR